MPSVCIFGSAARNQFDHLSDRDVLVVGQSGDEVNAVSQKWAGNGWSVAGFTEDHIVGMASSGSLFVQHLKQEGILVSDDRAFLSKVFTSYFPKPSYDREIDESIALLTCIERKPLSYWHWLCSCDIAYVSIRNIGIHKLASQGIYTFDFYKMISHLNLSRSIADKALNALRRLRHLKFAYRNRLSDVEIDGTLSCALDGAGQLFEVDVAAMRAFPPLGAGYNGLRRLELELVAEIDPRKLDCLEYSDPLADAWTMIADPRGYPKPWKLDEGWINAVREMAQYRCALR